MSLNGALRMLPMGLAILGIAVPLAGSGFSVWGLSVTWAVAIAVAIMVARLANPAPPNRVFAGLVAVVFLFLLAYEGGWWFIPAVLAQMAIDARAAQTERRSGDDLGLRH